VQAGDRANKLEQSGDENDPGTMAIRELLEEALQEPSIGSTSCFRWHATAVGIAALWNKGQAPYENALQEGLEVGLDLSREEREFHQIRSGLVLLFHS
jgi:hypothetical protein